VSKAAYHYTNDELDNATAHLSKRILNVKNDLHELRDQFSDVEVQHVREAEMSLCAAVDAINDLRRSIGCGPK
jgi:hypothetical protein